MGNRVISSIEEVYSILLSSIVREVLSKDMPLFIR